MELRDFIKEALKDILGGIECAQNEISSGEIIPNVTDTFQAVDAGISNIQTIDFEVTVTTDEKKGSEAKLNVIAAVIGGSVSGNSSNSNAYAGKLSFKIPVNFPRQCKEKKA